MNKSLLTVTLGLAFLIVMLLTMSTIRPPDVAQVQVSTTSGTLTNIVQVTPQESATSIYTETLTVQVSFTTTVVITPTAVSHELNGVGVHMFDADYHSPKFTSTLDTLGLKYLRVPFGPNWDDVSEPPPACNDETHGEDSESMYNFIKQNFNSDYPARLDNAKAISGIAEGRNIKIIFLNWRAHKNWLTDPTYKELKADYVDDYACFVTEIVKFLTDEGVKISYLEPTNEPSDTSDTKIPPERYNTFVTLLRKYLDGEGLSEVKILGPGLAYLNHDDTCRVYVEALDDDGVDAISVWASHAWDPTFYPNEPEEDVLRIKLEECQKAMKEQERPGQPKPIFITEYACVNDPGNGICAVENTLTLLDQGANAVVYWYLREQGWDMDPANRERALLTENYEEKPIFTALTSALPFISGDKVEVLETQVEGRITSASFYKADHELIVALVNSYPEPENVLIDINELVGVENEVLYISNTNTITGNLGIVQYQAYDNSTQYQLSLQSNAIMTLVFRRPLLFLPIVIKASLEILSTKGK